MTVLIRHASIDGERVDLRIRDDRIDAIGELTTDPGDEVLDADGGALLPGLTDHHLHLFAWAAADASVQCGPPTVRDRVGLAAALRSAPPNVDGWIRGVGYIESVAGELDSCAVDVLAGSDRPVRIAHRSGALWMLNAAAVAQLGLTERTDPGIERQDDGRPTGRLWRADHLLPVGSAPSLDAVGARLASWGITAVTDATPDGDAADFRLPQRVQSLGRTGTGPRKIVLRDDVLPLIDDIVESIRAARPRPVALHCVSRETLMLLLAAFDEIESIPGDRIEHGALIPFESIERIRAAGLCVVTQPGFIAARGDDYRRDIPVEDHADLYRYASLIRAGVRVLPSSDAPYGPGDPWQIIAAAHHRLAPDGPIAADERVPARVVLDGYLTRSATSQPTRLRPGGAADLVLLSVPLDEALARPSAQHVRMTTVSGQSIFSN
jgi:predicted amidohydrolase YtcJ